MIRFRKMKIKMASIRNICFQKLWKMRFYITKHCICKWCSVSNRDHSSLWCHFSNFEFFLRAEIMMTSLTCLWQCKWMSWCVPLNWESSFFLRAEIMMTSLTCLWQCKWMSWCVPLNWESNANESQFLVFRYSTLPGNKCWPKNYFE